MHITYILRSCLGVFSRNLFYISHYSYRPKFDSKAAIPQVQPELQPEEGVRALPEGVAERPYVAEPGDEDTEVHKERFPLISLILIGL
jgi:hypothetical protein